MSEPRSPSCAADRRCLVVVCHNSPVLFTQTVRSLMELGWGDRVARAREAHGFAAIDHFWSVNWPRVDALRDSAVALARQEGHSHILFLDGDMVWPTDLLQRILAHHDKGIVGGLYCLKQAPYSPVALRDHHRKDGSQVDQFHFTLEYETDLVEVDVLGMGCTLVPTAVFDAIGERPWFEYKNDDAGWPRVTEDVPFCLKAKAAGYKVYLDPTIKCGHVTSQVIDERWHKRYQASQAETSKRMNVAIFTSPHGDAPAAAVVGARDGD